MSEDENSIGSIEFLEEEFEDDTQIGIENVDKNIKWNATEIQLLISQYIECQHKFNSPQYNHNQVWKLISTNMKVFGVNKHFKKCNEKWRNLKKTYEKYKKHNMSTGNNKKYWKYYDALHDIFHKNPSINPIATISSTGLQRKRCNIDSNTAEERSTEIILNESTTSDTTTPERKNESLAGVTTPKRRYTKLSKLSIEDGRERRHRDKMEQKERMFQTFMDHIRKRDNIDS